MVISDQNDDNEAYRIEELTEFQYTILYILAEESRYGLGVKSALQEYYGDEIHHGRLYPNLDRLVELDLVAKHRLDSRTNEYVLTDRGRSAAMDRLQWAITKMVEDGEEAYTIKRDLDRSVLGE